MVTNTEYPFCSINPNEKFILLGVLIILEQLTKNEYKRFVESGFKPKYRVVKT